MDRLDAMQVLLAVVDEGSLSAGSRKLRAPLPSVSRKVAELERHLGTRLLIRTSRNIQLTDAGREYTESARRIVADLKDAELRASGEYLVPRGELTVTATLQFGQAVIAPLAYQFLKEHPEITLNMLLFDRRVNLIEENVDVDVHLGKLEDSFLFATKIGDIRIVTCASPAYLERRGRPSRPEDLAGHDAIISTQWSDVPWFYHCDEQRSEGMPNIRIRVYPPASAVTATVEGLGLTRVPHYMIEDELSTGKLVTILEDYDGESVPVHLVYVRQGLLPVKMRAFLDWITPRLRKLLSEAPIAPKIVAASVVKA